MEDFDRTVATGRKAETVLNRRVSIGSDYARNDVRAVVLEVFDEGSNGEQLAEKLEATADGTIIAHVDAGDIATGTADKQGRLWIGNEFKGKEVRVAVFVRFAE